jgi:hypothetical protein
MALRFIDSTTIENPAFLNTKPALQLAWFHLMLKSENLCNIVHIYARFMRGQIKREFARR